METLSDDVLNSHKKKARLIAKVNEECYLEEQTEVKLALLKMNKVCVTKIACSNKHSLVVSITLDYQVTVYKHRRPFLMGPKRLWSTGSPKAGRQRKETFLFKTATN